MTDTEPLWDTDQMAAHLHIGRRTVQQMVRDRRVPFVKVERTTRFIPAEVEKWLISRQHQAVR
jgi:excisionase family DNA binding protein